MHLIFIFFSPSHKIKVHFIFPLLPQVRQSSLSSSFYLPSFVITETKFPRKFIKRPRDDGISGSHSKILPLKSSSLLFWQCGFISRGFVSNAATQGRWRDMLGEGDMSSLARNGESQPSRVDELWVSGQQITCFSDRKFSGHPHTVSATDCTCKKDWII